MSDELLINVDINGQQQIDALDDKIDKLGKSTNRTQSEIQKIRKALKDAKSDMLAAEEGTDAYNNALARASAAQLKIKETNDKVRLGIKDFGETAKNVAQSVAGLSGGFTATIGVMGLFAGENENLAKAILGVQSALAVTQGLATFADSIDNIRDLYAGLSANLQSGKGAISEIGGAASESADDLGKMSKESAVLASNLAGADRIAKSSADSFEKMRKNAIQFTSDIKGVDVNFVPDPDEVNDAANQAKESYKKVTESVENTNKSVTDLGNSVTKTAGNIGKSLLTMGAFMVVIAAVTFAISKLIEYLNKVPKDLEIKLKLDEETYKKVESVKEKQLKFIADYQNAQKRGDKERITELEKLAKKEFDIDDEKFKRIGKTLAGWKEFFRVYLIEVQTTAYNEALIKIKAQKWVEAEILKAQQLTILKSVREQIKGTLREDIDPKQIDKLVKEFELGEMSGLNAALFGVSGLAKKWNDVADNISKVNEEIRTLNKTPFKITDTGKGLENIFGNLKPETAKQSGKPTNIGDPDYIKNLLDGIKERFDKELKDNPMNVDITDMFTLDDQEAVLKVTEPLKQVLETEQIDVLEFERWINTERQRLLDEEAELTISRFDMYMSYADSLASISDSISEIYDIELDKVQQVYDAKAAIIEQSLLTEEQKNAKLAQLDGERYEQQKKLFEEQKKFRIATVWLDFASGVMGAYTRALSPQNQLLSPLNWIAAGLEATALLATATAQDKAIRAQTLEAPKSATNSASTAVSVALTPNKTALTSKEDNLNMINEFGKNDNINIVKVSDINDVQKTVKVREQNSLF